MSYEPSPTSPVFDPRPLGMTWRVFPNPDGHLLPEPYPRSIPARLVDDDDRVIWDGQAALTDGYDDDGCRIYVVAVGEPVDRDLYDTLRLRFPYMPARSTFHIGVAVAPDVAPARD